MPGLRALGFSAAGYPITRSHPANPVGWCLMVAGVAAGVALVGLGWAPSKPWWCCTKRTKAVKN